MRLLVSGSRIFTDRNKLWEKLSELKPTIIIHGGARGVDTMADTYAKEHGIPCIKMEANWDYYQKAAGPIRNQWMLDLTNPDLVVAFPKGEARGTRHMMKIARAKGVEVIEVE